jgi:signal transduction histidine kinase
MTGSHEAPTRGSRDAWESLLLNNVRENYAVIAQGISTEEVCTPLLRGLVDNGVCDLARVWSVDPRQRRLVLIASVAGPDQLQSPQNVVIPTDTSFSGYAVEDRQVHVFNDLRVALRGRVFEQPDLLRQSVGIRSLLSIPIRNIGNPHQVLLVVNLYGKAEFKDVERLKQILARHANLVAAAVEANLRERAFRWSLELSRRIGRLELLTEKAACRVLVETTKDALDADMVTLYLENWSGQKLEERYALTQSDESAGAPGVVAPHVEQVWRENREYLALGPDQGSIKELLGTPQTSPIHSVLFVPLHDVGGGSRGVLRCVNRKRDGEPSYRRSHSYDDVAVIEAMDQAFAPPLETLLATKQRDVALQKLAHELRVPVVAFRAVLERMESEYVEQTDFRFRYPHFRELANYSDLMQRLVKELDLVRVGLSEVTIVLQPTNVLAEIVAPTVRFIAPLLKRRRFTPLQLKVEGFGDWPLYVLDPATLTQVLFNLLENAIKYFPRARLPAEFDCTISGQISAGAIEIRVADNGDGVPEIDRERIFEFQYRSAGADQADVSGNGIGLWISRAIARRHGGELRLEKARDKTTFLLRLPVRRPPPPMHYQPHRKET